MATRQQPLDFPIDQFPSPSYVVDERLLIRNLEILKSVQDRTGCKILLAQKGFSMYKTFPLIGQYLKGVTSSSLFEARLGREEMDSEVHIFSPAYREDEFDEILSLCDHVVFNSFSQWQRYKDTVQSCGKPISCGLRINPEYSETEPEIYNPCAKNSRMGITLQNFQPELLEGIEGLHFHTMCEQNADPLERTLDVVEKKFGPYLHQMKWLNFGGGHHITRPDYDIECLVRCIQRMRDKYDLEIYLEPGEAIALNTGYLTCTVLDLTENGMHLAILDTSAACHMPDVLEMPYRPNIIGAGLPGEKPYTYRFGGPTCLSGDIIGDYSFDEPLQIGDRLTFCDMAHYTMVKNNTFNGMNLPAICLYHADGTLEVCKEFGYENFKARL
jgi:carboxynorspermidine decarboxylase